jgi:hypothetical protein
MVNQTCPRRPVVSELVLSNVEGVEPVNHRPFNLFKIFSTLLIFLIFSPARAFADGYYSFPNLAGDANIINFADFADFAVFAQNWQKTGSNLPGDFDGSGRVDFNDLKILCDYWLAGAQSPQDVFNLFKTALAAGDIDKAVGYVSEMSRDKYSGIFHAIEANLPDFANGMGQLSLVSFDSGEAKYEMTHQQNEWENISLSGCFCKR